MDGRSERGVPGGHPIRLPSDIVKRAAGLIGLTLLAFAAAYATTRLIRPGPTRPAGMVWIPGGEFVMGSEHAGAPNTERPTVGVRVDGFWMDEHEVTNAGFRRFVEATSYVTTAEKPPKADVPPDI